MNSTRDFKVRFFCCLWLYLALSERVLCQDITPELPEDFPTSTEHTMTTAAATTTEEATTITPVTTTTTEAPTTTAEATTPSYGYLPPKQPTMRSFYYPYPTYAPPTYAPPSSPPVPAYTPAYHFLWDLDNSGEERCYLKNQVERSYFRLCCHCSDALPSLNCYRCCYYGHSRFAGCSKLHNGQCTPDSIGSRYRK